MLVQAAALVGAFWTGRLAHKRRVEMELLNSKLRAINSELRRQWEEVGGGEPDPALLADATSAAAEAQAAGGDAEAAARGVLAAAAAEMAAARDALESSLQAPSAAHPWEGLGPDGRLSLAGARRRVAAAIRDCKLLLRAAAAAEAGVPTPTAPQLAAAGSAPAPAPSLSPAVAAAAEDPLRRCFALLEEAEALADEMRDARAVLAAARLRARALRQGGDPAGGARELRRCLALGAELGHPESAEVLGELGDVLTGGRGGPRGGGAGGDAALRGAARRSATAPQAPAKKDGLTPPPARDGRLRCCGGGLRPLHREHGGGARPLQPWQRYVQQHLGLGGRGLAPCCAGSGRCCLVPPPQGGFACRTFAASSQRLCLCFT